MIPSSGGRAREFHLSRRLVEEELEKIAFLAEINSLSSDSGHTKWRKVFPTVMSITAVKCRGPHGLFLRVFIVNKEDKKRRGIDIPLPASRLKRTSECFTQWRDKKHGGAWGLNFVSEKDAGKFSDICSTEKLSSDSTAAAVNSAGLSSSSGAKNSELASSRLSSSMSSLHTSGEAGTKSGAFGSMSDIRSEHESKSSRPAIKQGLLTGRKLSEGSSSFHFNKADMHIVVDDDIPVGFDPTEYEYLQSQKNENALPYSSQDHAMQMSSANISTGKSSKSASQNSLVIPPSNFGDDSRSRVSEDFLDSRPPSAINLNRQIMTTRKTGWLVVKNILIHSKKGKLELASSRKWRKYWVALKGTELMFYHADEKTVTNDDLDEPSHQLDVDNCIAQAVPEYPRLENVFSLSTKHGNAYYLQSTKQAEVDNWIHCIHSAAAMALSRRKSNDNIAACLGKEIELLTQKLESEEKLKKMAELQLTVETEQHSRQNMTGQISSWNQSLELLNADIFRLQCYVSAITGAAKPNPQDLMTHVSRTTKQELSKINVLSVTSFYSLVCTRNSTGPPPEQKPKKVKSQGLKAKLLNSFKMADDAMVTAIRSRHITTPKMGRRRQLSNDSSDGDSNASSRGTLGKRGRVGDTLYIQIPGRKSAAIPYEGDLQIDQLLERVCMKEQLDSIEYFVMLMTEENHNHGLLDYTIPKGQTPLDSFKYTSIKLCPKLIYDVKLSNPAEYEHGAFGLELVQLKDERIVVTVVEEGSPAHKAGILTDDEVIGINGQDLRQLSNSFNDVLEVLNTSQTIEVELRSSRIDDPKKTLQTTENMISFLVCPPPPKSGQPDLSDDILISMIVPAPCDEDDAVSSRVAHSQGSGSTTAEAKVEDIDQFLHRTEEVNIMTREMNALVDSSKSPSASSGKVEEKLRKVITELLDTEKNYVKNLKILLERFLVPLKDEHFLNRDEAELLVNNVEEIYNFQTTFFENLKAIVKADKGFETYSEMNQFQNILYSIGETFLEYVEKFKLYSTFCSCHSRAVKLLDVEANQPLQAFLLARNPKQQHHRTLESFLIIPIQRVLKYPLLMKQMLKYMTQGMIYYFATYMFF